MTDVHIERTELDDGIPMMHRTDRHHDRIRVAYDPRQITEDAALAVLYARHPRLVAHSRAVRIR